ncbi:leucine-rich repeat and fibronectin type III domain-containing protein 1-like protein [Argopecten irradians]|uniref:leucine-rich repeat and fibronectin type III domain-containing protein 1-like protein n=1 Tax=Argopecten irradians TaxID=31199 RepID=UPI003716AB1F
MPRLVTLKMTHCAISAIADDTFSTRTSLTYLDLSYNNIIKINDQTFVGLTNLTSLQISGNPYCEISEKAFDSLSNLQGLYIADMDLERLLPEMFASMKNLRVLDIHGNKIWKIEFDFRFIFPSLQHFDVSNNLLEGLPKIYKDSFATISTLKLSGNPLQCNCELRWLKSDPKKVFDPEYASKALVCAGPERVKYAPILRLPDIEFKCVSPQIVNCATETYIMMQTTSAKMSCELAGDPYPDVTWIRFDGKHVQFTYENTSNYYVSRKGILEIFNVSQADEGTWNLSVNNIVGQKSHQLKVIVIPKTITTTTLTTAAATKTTSTTSTPFTTIANLTTLTTLSTTTTIATRATSRETRMKTSSNTTTTTITTRAPKLGLVCGIIGGIIMTVVFSVTVYCVKWKNSTVSVVNSWHQSS